MNGKGTLLRIVLGLLVFLTLTSLSHAVWDELETDVDDFLYGSDFITEEIGFVAGWGVSDGGVILRTLDGGDNWTTTIPLQGSYLFGVEFLDEETGFVAGYNPATTSATVLSTFDGGENWEVTNLTQSFGAYVVDFVDNDIGYVCGYNGAVFKSTDGGENWTLLVTGTTDVFRWMHAVNEDVVYVVGGDSFALVDRIYRTTDGGESWTQVYNFNGTMSIGGIYFFEDNTGIIVGHSGSENVRRTTDGGVTWTSVYLTGENQVLQSLSVDGNYCWTVGGEGNVHKSTDQGQTWSFEETINVDYLMTIAKSGGCVFASGSGGSIFKHELDYEFSSSTTNNPHLITAGEVVDYSFSLMNNGLQDDIYDIVLDAGLPDNWTISYSTPDGEQTGNSTITLNAGEEYQGNITLTTDDLEGVEAEFNFNITSQSMDELQQSAEFFTLSSADILVINNENEGQYDLYYRMALDEMNILDEEISYGVYPSHQLPLDYDEVVNADPGLIICYTGADGDIEDDLQDAFEVLLEDGTSLMITGSNLTTHLAGSNLLTMMGADHQSNYDAESAFGIEGDPIGDGIEFDLGGGDGANNLGSPTSITLVGTGVECLRYSNVRRAGIRNETENYRSLILGFPFEAISNADDRTQLISQAVYWLLDMDFETTPEFNNASLPGSFELLPVYPNPFNPVTTVTVGLPVTSDLRLNVYNALGQQVTTLADGNCSQGYHRFRFDGSGLSSGIYYIDANVPGQFKQVQKVVLMK